MATTRTRVRSETVIFQGIPFRRIPHASGGTSGREKVTLAVMASQTYAVRWAVSATYTTSLASVGAWANPLGFEGHQGDNDGHRPVVTG